MDRFRKFKRLIPVYGAILMDAAMERVLLVRCAGEPRRHAPRRGESLNAEREEGEKEVEGGLRRLQRGRLER
eukprot:272366-Chlamydomonas_euryale.AAC.1